MIRKYATATIIGHELIPADADGKQLRKAAHRAVFDYVPRPGYLYVRSRMISSRCNDNHDEFPAEEIKAAWKTAIGKPAFVNHRNEDHRRMRGVIIDAALHEDVLPTGEPDIWVEALHEVDAIRFPKLAESIIEGRVNRTSMGCDVGFSVCSACGNKASTPAEYCEHIPKMKGKILYRHTASGKREGHLIREICHKLSFFENSFLVEDPADPTAVVTGVDTRGLSSTAAKGSMRKEAVPQGLRFHFTPADDERMGKHTLRALLPTGDQVGSLQWSATKEGRGAGMVDMVKTHPDYERQGIASALWRRGHELANEHGLSIPAHSDVQFPAGRNWAEKVDREPVVMPGQQPLFAQPEGYHTEIEDLSPQHADLHEHIRHEHDADPSWAKGNEDALKAWHQRFHSYGDVGHRHAFRKSAGFFKKKPPIDWMDDPDRKVTDLRNGLHLIDHLVREHGWSNEAFEGASKAGSGEGWRKTHDRLHREGVPGVTDDDSMHFHAAVTKTAALPNDMRFTYNEPDDFVPAHRISVDFKAKNGRRVKGGHIWWHPEDGSVIHIQVPRKYQGSGIASALWQRAHELSSAKGLPTPVHSDVQTPQGKDWAASVDKKGLPTMPGPGQQELFDIPEERKTRINPTSSLPSWPEQPEDYIPWKNRPEGAPAEDAGMVPSRDQSRFVMKPPNWEPGIQSIDPEKQCVGCGADLQVKPYQHMQRGHADYGFCTDCQRESGVTIRSGEPGYVNRRERSRSGVPRETKPFDPGMVSLNTIRTQTEGRLKTLAEYEKSSLPAATAAGPAHSNPAEHPFFKANPVSAENVINSFMRADDGRRAQGMRWYSDAHHLAGLIADGDHAKGAGVLAAYSPKAAWPDNMFNAARSLREGTALGKGEGASVMGMHQRLAQKVMDGEHHSKVMKSPKISDFAHLIEHGDDTPDDKEAGKTRVVVDRHALSVATGRRMTTQDLSDAPLGSRHYYEHVAETYRVAAKHLSEHLGVEIKPHQVQAVTWGVQQEENERADEAAAQAHARGRATRTKNSWTRWEEHSKEQYPTIHEKPPNLHAERPYEDKDEQKTGRKEVRASSLPSFRGRA